MILYDGAGIDIEYCSFFRPKPGFLVAPPLILPRRLTLQAPFGAHERLESDVRASYAKSST